eukprot:TRINITY_DN41284_c0_g1_i2.p2 TRINITY_DN41284_c0_g1~~TRINITY_DN41284_c0_g1_i2.p2  ORF type:complete len:623 (-),score=122.13 TRINITY_DN41284_c0_g1_i2:3050-4918(-)
MEAQLLRQAPRQEARSRTLNADVCSRQSVRVRSYGGGPGHLAPGVAAAATFLLATSARPWRGWRARRQVHHHAVRRHSLRMHASKTPSADHATDAHDVLEKLHRYAASGASSDAVAQSGLERPRKEDLVQLLQESRRVVKEVGASHPSFWKALEAMIILKGTHDLLNQLMDDCMLVIRELPAELPLAPQHLATAAVALAKYRRSDRVAWACICERACRSLPQFDMPSLASLSWALAVQDIKAQALFRDIAKRAEACAHRASASELSQVAWALSRSRKEAKEFFAGAAARRAVVIAKDFTAKELDDFAWACATQARASGHDEQLSVALAGNFLGTAHDMSARQLCNVAWSFSSLSVANVVPDAFVLLSQLVTSKAVGLDSLGLSRLAWAFAKQSIQRQAQLTVLRLIMQETADTGRARSDFSAQSVANVAWAFAKIQMDADSAAKFFDVQVAPVVLRMVQQFKPQEFSSLLWSYAKLQLDDKEARLCIEDAVQQKVRALSAQGLANISWAAATLRGSNHELYSRLEAAAETQVHACSSQHIANLCWAFAKMSLESQSFIRLVMPMVPAKAATYSPQNLANLLWACATVSLQQSAATEAICKQAMSKVSGFEPQGGLVLLCAPD